LEAVVKKAHGIKGTSMVVTFWPHPQEEESLYSLKHRLRLIEEIGIDVCIVINFNQKFANLPAIDFIKDILLRKINANYIYVGRNFRFGRNAEGGSGTLERLSKKHHFKLKLFKVVKIHNRPISSTNIRSLTKKGRLDLARKLLTRPVSILGTVIRGSLLGRKLGFPTANINPHHEVIPPRGVYEVGVIFNNKKFRGICYIGYKPTLLAKNRKLKAQGPLHIEVHIFNFNKKIYDRYLEIQFVKKIREEKKFPSTLALAEQIKKDVWNLQKTLP
jgi:riboflavin kinase/FMN adenylyltransferase